MSQLDMTVIEVLGYAVLYHHVVRDLLMISTKCLNSLYVLLHVSIVYI